MSKTDQRAPAGNRWLVVLALVSSSLFGPSAVVAQITHDFRILPDPEQTRSTNRAFLVYSLSAASKIDDVVLVKNMGKEQLHLLLYPGDAVTGSRGGVGIATQEGENPSQAGAWLRLTETQLTVAPGEDRSVSFSLEVPSETPPGEYAATIVVQRVEPEAASQSRNLGIHFIPRAGVTVLVTVPGPEPLEPRLEIRALESATRGRQQTVVASLGNPGNAGVQSAEGSLIVRQLDGTLSREIPVRLGYVLAGGDLRNGIGLQPALTPDHYDVTLSLTYSGGTIERTERLLLGQAAALPIIRAPEPELDPANLEGLPPWVMATLVGAGTIILLMAVLLARLAIRLRKTQGQ